MLKSLNSCLNIPLCTYIIGIGIGVSCNLNNRNFKFCTYLFVGCKNIYNIWLIILIRFIFDFNT